MFTEPSGPGQRVPVELTKVPVCVVSLVGLPLASMKPLNRERQGTKFGSRVPAWGSALGLLAAPVGKQPAGAFAEKKVARQPGSTPPKATGRKGVWKESWSTVPTSSRT